MICSTVRYPLILLIRADRLVDAVLAVRTFSSTHILRLKHSDFANLKATNLYEITRKDMENETAVDIRHLPSSNVVLAVGDGGTVFACDPTNGAKEMSPFHSGFMERY